MRVSLSNIAGTQLSGLTGRKVKMPYNQMVLSQTPAAESLYQSQIATRQAADQFERSQALQKYIADEQNKEAGKASMISGANTLMSLAALSKDTAAGKAVTDALAAAGNKATATIGDALNIMPGKLAPEGSNALAGTTSQAAQGVAGTTLGKIGTSVGSKIGATAAPYVTQLGENIGTETAKSTTKGLAKWLSGEAAKQATTEAAATGASSFGSLGSSLGSIAGGVSTAVPYYALAKIGGLLGNAVVDNNPGMENTALGNVIRSLKKDPLAVEDYYVDYLADRGGFGDHDTLKYTLQDANPLEVGSWFTGTADKAKNTATLGLYKPFTDDFKGSAARMALAPDPLTGYLSTVSSGMGDAGKVVSAILNPIGAIVGGGCIIVTACTGRDSDEVNITRQYRDTFLSPLQLRGYYALAEKVVPCMERHAGIRKSVKKYLVDKLIDYGKYRLELSDKKPDLSSVLVSKTFLALITSIGMMIPRYVRANGEVY